jgi:hypothetical protein
METKHPNDMDKEELRELVWQMSSWALDLAQHLDFTLNALKVQYRKEAYERAIQMAWQICYAWEHEPDRQGNMEIAYFGENGLTVTKGDFGELIDGSLLPLKTLDKKGINFTEFEEVFTEIEQSQMSEEEILEREKTLKFWRDVENGKVGKDHVEVTVKTLRKLLFPMEYILQVTKDCKKLVSLMRGEIDKIRVSCLTGDEK